MARADLDGATGQFGACQNLERLVGVIAVEELDETVTWVTGADGIK
jgi:hypothetical protein